MEKNFNMKVKVGIFFYEVMRRSYGVQQIYYFNDFNFYLLYT